MSAETVHVAYARKSTRAEDKQVLSLQDQKAELKAMARKRGLAVVRTLAESQSASTPGRPVFNEMIGMIERGEASAILTWKFNRLARNFEDGGKIISLLQSGKLREICTPSKTFLPSDNVLLLAIELGIANQYSRDLAEDTRRGLDRKVARGEYPNGAPFGYRNARREKRGVILVDRHYAPLVKRVFEMYATGDYTLADLRAYFTSCGVTSKRGGGLCRRKTVPPHPYFSDSH